MGSLKNIKIFAIAGLVIFLSITTVAHAMSFEELVEEGRRLLGGKQTAKHLTANSNLEVTSDIQLTENGDLDKNGAMDGGDTVRFSFVISNGTDEPHPFSNLKTNIKRDSIHFIHNIKGVTGIDNNTLELPNIYVLPHSKIEISFDAQLNFSGEEEIISKDLTAKTIDANGDKEISSEPQLEDNKKKRLAEGIKRIKKFKAAANKNGVKAKQKNIQQESTGSASVVTESAASPSARVEAIKDTLPASQSAKEGSENAN